MFAIINPFIIHNYISLLCRIRARNTPTSIYEREPCSYIVNMKFTWLCWLSLNGRAGKKIDCVEFC